MSETNKEPRAEQRKPRPQQGRKRRKRKKKKNLFKTYLPHIIVLVVVIVIAIIAIWKIYDWNKGVESDYDPTEDTSEWDVETEDYIVPLLDEAKSLQVDDGVETVLLLGNDPFTSNNDDTGIPALIEQRTGATVVDAAIGHSTIGTQNMEFSTENFWDGLSFKWVASCIEQRDYTLLYNHAVGVGDDGSIKEAVDRMASLDMATVDTVVIMYDARDYKLGYPAASIYDMELPASVAGCLREGLATLQRALPQARIIFSSPYYCYIENPKKDGEYIPCTIAINGMTSGDKDEYSYGSLGDYVVAYKAISVDAGINYIDNYFGTITEDNYQEMLKNDNTVLSSDGRKAIADRISEFLEVQ